jgi:uncharacterized protein (TIGR03000 family)
MTNPRFPLIRSRVLLPLLLSVLGSTVARAQPAVLAEAVFVVHLPREDAEVTIDGQPATGNGPIWRISSPPLEAGVVHERTFVVKWRPNNYTLMTRRVKVSFKAGEAVNVDLGTAYPDDRAEIRYVPTPDDVAAEMARLAEVRPGDVAFELGCGDARIAIAAVHAGASRAVGIDIDPQLVERARNNVTLQGLRDKIEIRLGDALDVKDLAEASVVLLYMGDEFNLLLRPLL